MSNPHNKKTRASHQGLACHDLQSLSLAWSYSSLFCNKKSADLPCRKIRFPLDPSASEALQCFPRSAACSPSCWTFFQGLSYHQAEGGRCLRWQVGRSGPWCQRAELLLPVVSLQAVGECSPRANIKVRITSQSIGYLEEEMEERHLPLATGSKECWGENPSLPYIPSENCKPNYHPARKVNHLKVVVAR